MILHMYSFFSAILKGLVRLPVSCYLYQLRVSFNCFLNPLWLNTNIPLCDRCAAMLQQPLHQRNIISVGFINLRGVPPVKAVVRPFPFQIFHIKAMQNADCFRKIIFL